MDIEGLLREEIQRRGLTPTDVANGADLPFSTVSEFLRGGREIGSRKASKIAEWLGFSLVISQVRRKSMERYLKTVEELEGQGIPTDNDSVAAVEQYVRDLKWLEEHGQKDWTEEDAELAATFAANLKWLEENNQVNWCEEDADQAAGFVSNITWLEEHGWEAWGEDDTEAADTFVSNLQWLEERGEDATEDRMKDVAEFVANLEWVEERGEDATEDRMKDVAEFVANLRAKDE